MAAGHENVTAILIRGTEVTTLSGIAPARVAMYKVCCNAHYVNPEGVAQRGCFFGETMATLDQAIMDGADILDDSISSAVNPKTPVSKACLRATQNRNVFCGICRKPSPAIRLPLAISHPG
jgi:hypothetical protein